MFNLLEKIDNLNETKAVKIISFYIKNIQKKLDPRFDQQLINITNIIKEEIVLDPSIIKSYLFLNLVNNVRQKIMNNKLNNTIDLISNFDFKKINNKNNIFSIINSCQYYIYNMLTLSMHCLYCTKYPYNTFKHLNNIRKKCKNNFPPVED